MRKNYKTFLKNYEKIKNYKRKYEKNIKIFNRKVLNSQRWNIHLFFRTNFQKLMIFVKNSKKKIFFF